MPKGDNRFPRSTQEPEPTSRHLHAGCRAGSQQAAPCACPTVTTPPWFRHHLYAFDTSSAVHLRSSLRFIPDRVSPDRFPARAPPRLLNAAAVGGLVPAPVRRHRGAFPHLLCSLAAQKYFSSFAPSWRTVVCIADDNDMSAIRTASPFVCPQIKNVMEVNIRQ